MFLNAMEQDDDLADFLPREILLLGTTKRVHVAGQGPAVIVMPEMPGISPHVARFARWVRDAGFTVYMPSPFGDDGRIADAEAGAEVFRRACMSAEFNAFRRNKTSPIVQWLRALASLAHLEAGGRGIGAIGMCFTGNFALSMMLEPAMLAPVLSQPSLPLNDPGGLEIDPAELVAIRQRLDREGLEVLAYRFSGDEICQAERFEAYAEALGNRFIGRTLPDEAANPYQPEFFARYVRTPHSVVTAHLIDEAGQPTIGARDEILSFFKSCLSDRVR